jgi:hypothetical protein
MANISYSNLYDIEHDHMDGSDVVVGDLVRTGPNAYPYFRVLAVFGDKAWVRNVQTGADGITLASRCRHVNGAQ